MNESGKERSSRVARGIELGEKWHRDGSSETEKSFKEFLATLTPEEQEAVKRELNALADEGEFELSNIPTK